MAIAKSLSPVQFKRVVTVNVAAGETFRDSMNGSTLTVDGGGTAGYKLVISLEAMSVVGSAVSVGGAAASTATLVFVKEGQTVAAAEGAGQTLSAANGAFTAYDLGLNGSVYSSVYLKVGDGAVADSAAVFYVDYVEPARADQNV
jgi:hypothetical protein